MRGYARLRQPVEWFHRQVHGRGRPAATVWFQVYPCHPDLWGSAPTEPVTVDAGLLARLAAGLRMDEVASVVAAPGAESAIQLATAPAPRPATTVQRSYAGLASLLRQTTRCLVGVPEGLAVRMAWAAAGCGLLASRVDALPVGARICPPGTVLNATALPGWMVGTDESGVPVQLNLPPGSTTVITGADTDTVAATIAPSGRVLGQDVAVVHSIEEWKAAWHPQQCRVLVDPTGEMAGGEVVVDATVDLNAGRVSVGGGTQIGITALPLRR